MTTKMFIYWLPMVAIAFMNAAIREVVLQKYFSGLRSNQLSTLTLIILCTAYTWFILPYLDIGGNIAALITGLLWVFLTVAFEFGLGLLTKHTWPEMLQQYNLLAGHFWPFFLVCLLFLPYICYVLRR